MKPSDKIAADGPIFTAIQHKDPCYKSIDDWSFVDDGSKIFVDMNKGKHTYFVELHTTATVEIILKLQQDCRNLEQALCDTIHSSYGVIPKSAEKFVTDDSLNEAKARLEAEVKGCRPEACHRCGGLGYLDETYGDQSSPKALTTCTACNGTGFDLTNGVGPNVNGNVYTAECMRTALDDFRIKNYGIAHKEAWPIDTEQQKLE